jgi:Family of unknown function (DUF5988)
MAGVRGVGLFAAGFGHLDDSSPFIAALELGNPSSSFERVTSMNAPQEMAKTFTKAVLEGGPQTLPKESRSLLIDPTEEKIKVPHYGGYEHFVRTNETVQDEVVFLWNTRTEVAE